MKLHFKRYKKIQMFLNMCSYSLLSSGNHYSHSLAATVCVMSLTLINPPFCCDLGIEGIVKIKSH